MAGGTKQVPAGAPDPGPTTAHGLRRVVVEDPERARKLADLLRRLLQTARPG